MLYLQENAFDDFQIIKICPCEITKNKLHELVHLVIFQSHNANLNILPVKLTDSHRKKSEYKKKKYICMCMCVCVYNNYILFGGCIMFLNVM